MSALKSSATDNINLPRFKKPKKWNETDTENKIHRALWKYAANKRILHSNGTNTKKFNDTAR